jgi:hypothetical protein
MKKATFDGSFVDGTRAFRFPFQTPIEDSSASLIGERNIFYSKRT